jgi:steroid 5-alpha reductase family enzyme
MASISALRLAASLLATPVIARPESSRMRLGQEERRRLPLRLLLFFELQALLCAVLSLPLAIASQNRARFLHPLEYFGAALWLAAVTGLSLAHHRFHRFTMHPGNRRRVRHTGFRRYCPTPDDFFEWLIWVGYAVFALGSPGGVAGLLAPAWILFVRLRDRESLAAGTHTIGGRGDACRQDPRSASRLFSWPPSA